MTVIVKNIKLEGASIYKARKEIKPGTLETRFPYGAMAVQRDNPEHPDLFISERRIAPFERYAWFRAANPPIINVDDWQKLESFIRCCNTCNMNVDYIWKGAIIDIHITAKEELRRDTFVPSSYLLLEAITCKVGNLNNPENYRHE